MKILVLILSVLIFIKTLSYGIFEIKSENNSGGIVVIVVSAIALILPIVTVYIRGI